MRATRILAVAALALALLGQPLAAYVIVLKDGSKVITRDKYRIEEGGKAVFLLQNGTESFLELREIDVQKTEEANKNNYGSAVELQGGKVRQMQQATPAPKPARLSDLIAARGGDGTLRGLPATTRRPTTDRSVARPGQTAAGYQDLTTYPRNPLRSTELAATLIGFFQAQGVEGVMVYQGTGPKHPLVEFTTASEASVFRAILTSANALLVARDKHRDAIDGLDVVRSTPQRSRAGQFELTPEIAADLISRRLDLTDYYVKNVQF